MQRQDYQHRGGSTAPDLILPTYDLSSRNEGPASGVFGNPLVTIPRGRDFTERQTFKEHGELRQNARPSGLDQEYPGPVYLVPLSGARTPHGV